MGNDIEIRVSHTQVEIIPHCKNALSLFVYGKEVHVKPNNPVAIAR
ncbi:MAG: hypothetical protein QM786_03885 [Breznakibacter sp.]